MLLTRRPFNMPITLPASSLLLLSLGCVFLSVEAIRIKQRGNPEDFLNFESRLLYDLFSYEANPINIRPLNVSAEYIGVYLDSRVPLLLDLDEKDQVLTTFVSLQIGWTDELRSWNPEDYGNVTSVIVPATKVWTPPISLGNGIGEVFGEIFDMSKYRVRLTYAGESNITIAGVFRTSCLLNVTNFPFDSAACYIQIETWATTNDQLMIIGNVDQELPKSSQWNVFLIKARSSVLKGMYYVRIILFMHRKSLYFTLLFLIPTILFTLLSPMIFLVPVPSCEKITFQLTIIAALTVELINLSQRIPHTSDYLPALSKYISGMMITCMFSVFLSMLTQELYYSNESPLEKIQFYKKSEKKNSLRSNNTYKISNNKSDQQDVTDISYYSSIDDKEYVNNENCDNSGSIRTDNDTNYGSIVIDRSPCELMSNQEISILCRGNPECRKLSEIIDRILFLIHLIIILVSTVVLVSNLTSHSQGKLRPIGADKGSKVTILQIWSLAFGSDYYYYDKSEDDSIWWYLDHYYNNTDYNSTDI